MLTADIRSWVFSRPSAVSTDVRGDLNSLFLRRNSPALSKIFPVPLGREFRAKSAQ
jgi:hypothetical protein